MKPMKVVKRNENTEEYDIEKIHKVLEWATKGIAGVSFSDIEMNAKLALYDKVSTKEIHKVLIKSANDLISEQTPNYQYVAARLLNFSLRKEVWGSKNQPTLLSIIKDNVNTHHVYNIDILKKWTEEDIVKIDAYIDHDRDDFYTYAGLQQMVDKYLLKNRSTNKHANGNAN